MSITGLPTISLLEMPLVGKAALFATLSSDVTNDVTVEAYLLSELDDTLAGAIIKKTSDAGSVIVTDTPAQVYLDFDSIVSQLSQAHLYYLVVRFVDISSSAVTLVNTFTVLPVQQPITRSFPLTGMAATLSTKFINTIQVAGLSGGDGFLDGLSTLAQPVRCWVTFTVGGGQPEEWELVVWTDASMNTDAGVYQQPVDFNSVSNPKVWIRRS